jgi:cytochrome c oxidase subunit 2
MFYSILICVFVFFFLYITITKFNSVANPSIMVQKFTHSSAMEIVWTITPAFVLLLIATPSFSLLYSLDELVRPGITVKIIGHQWYWSYELSDWNLKFKAPSLRYDSYMRVFYRDLDWAGFRLLEVDHRLVLPVRVHIRLLITASDVLHSWAIPSFGIKVDACPGRLSQASLFIKRQGLFYGQCSEICGINHGFMPIVVRSVEKSKCILWAYGRVKYGYDN